MPREREEEYDSVHQQKKLMVDVEGVGTFLANLSWYINPRSSLGGSNNDLMIIALPLESPETNRVGAAAPGEVECNCTTGVASSSSISSRRVWPSHASRICGRD